MLLPHHRKAIRASALVTVVVLCVRLASAAAEDAERSSGHATVDQPAPRSTEARDADSIFAEAAERYQAGDLRGALDLLQQCYGATQDSNLLFNIAQVLRDLHDCAGAVDHYRRYVRDAPQGERVADAERQIANLEPNCRATEAARKKQDQPAQPEPEPQPAASPAELAPSKLWPIVGWTSCSVSVLAATAATYFGIESHAAKRDVEQLQQQPPFQASYLQTRLDDFYRDRNWAVGFGIASGVTAAVGLYLLLVAPPERAQQSRIAATSVPGRSLDLQLSF